MPSFLINRKMSPELAARIHVSLRGGSPYRPASRLTPRFTAWLRIAAVATTLGAAGLLVGTVREQQARVESARADLLTAFRSQASRLSDSDRELVTRVEAALMTAADAYGGDSVAPELKGSTDALTALLGRPAVYVRGPIEDLRTPARIASVASEAGKDAFVLCLIAPPIGKTEAAMLTSAQAAYHRKPLLAESTARVQPLYPALVGLPWLAPSFAERIEQARDEAQLAKLRQGFEDAPTHWAIEAAKAETLIYLQDEPKDSGGTELDGASLHHVRVGIVELASGKTLLSLRRQVDPAWVSEARRSRLAREFNGCRLALEVREALLGSAAN